MKELQVLCISMLLCSFGNHLNWIKYEYVILFIIINYTVYYAGKHKHKWPSS